MKSLSIISAIFLFLAIGNMPYDYYTLLRVIVTINASIILYKNFENELSLTVLVFGTITILFNPIFPISFDKGTWQIIDFVVALIFVNQGFSIVRKINNHADKITNKNLEKSENARKAKLWDHMNSDKNKKV